ncbi:MAG: hypothetical protein JJV97_03840 [SAR324 cluster bacterium]|nr:hypothetical protein [SAR324 cluster bacterium]
MRLILLSNSSTIDDLTAVFKYEAKLLESKIEILKPGDRFWQMPDFYCRNLGDKHCWILACFSELGLKKFKALLNLSNLPQISIICWEQNFNILHLLARLHPTSEKNTQVKQLPADLGELTKSLEKASLKQDYKLSHSFDNLINLKFKEGQIEHILFDGKFKNNPQAWQQLTEDLFAQKRQIFCQQQKEKLAENRVKRLTPSLKIVTTSNWLDGLLNEHWHKSTLPAKLEPYILAKPLVQPLLIRTIKSYFINQQTYQDYHHLFDSVIKLGDQLFNQDEQPDEKKNYQSLAKMLVKFRAMEPAELVTAFNNNLLELQNKQKIKKLALQEKYVIAERQLNLKNLRDSLAKATEFTSLDGDENSSQQILLLSYDEDMLSEIYQGIKKNSRVLWLDLNRIKTIDDLAKLDFSKYHKFGKKAVIITSKSCAKRISRWLLNAENKGVTEGSLANITEITGSEYLQLEKFALQRVMIDLWEPILKNITAQCIDQESVSFIGKINKKLASDKDKSIKKAFSGNIFQIGYETEFFTNFSEISNPKNNKHEEHSTNVSSSQYLYNYKNISKDWQNIKTKLAGIKPDLVICQLNLESAKMAQPILKEFGTTIIIFWQGYLGKDMISKYDQPNWELFYYTNPNNKNKLIAKLIKNATLRKLN